VACSSGFVDVVTPHEIIEVKRAQLWKGGLGQVLVYSKDFPGLSPRLHLFGPRSYEHFALARAACEMFGVSVTTDEGHTLPADRPVFLPAQHAQHAQPAQPAQPAGREIDPGQAPVSGSVRISGRRGTVVDLMGSPHYYQMASTPLGPTPGASPGPSTGASQIAYQDSAPPRVRARREVNLARPGTPPHSSQAPSRRSWRAWGAMCLGYVCGRSA
jgi:hypothetical protein